MEQSDTSPPEALPKWLSEDYFRSLFRRKSPGEEVKVTNVTLKFAGEERTHGQLFRAVVGVDTPSGAKSFCYFIKTTAPDTSSETLACANTYRMEALVLGKIIPAMEKVLDAVAPGKYGQLAPRLIDHGIDKGNMFIMTEDLTVQGFHTGSRKEGLNLDHCLAYAKHLAVFHASSAATLELHESEISSIPLFIDSDDCQILNNSIGSSVKGVLPTLESHQDLSEYVDHVRKLGATLPARLAEANHRHSAVLNVVCHGDMFVNNILFRHGEQGSVSGVRLVDFQLSRVGSFADDLIGFLLSAASDDVLEHHADLVVDTYRSALNETLSALGLSSRALSQEALGAELRAQRAVAQFAVFHVLPHARAPAAVDLRAGHDAFADPGYARLLTLLLPRLQALGWLEESEDIREASGPDNPNKDEVQTQLLLFGLILFGSLLEKRTLEKIFSLFLQTAEEALPSYQQTDETTLAGLHSAEVESNTLRSEAKSERKCHNHAYVSTTTKCTVKMNTQISHVSASEHSVCENFEFTEPNVSIHRAGENLSDIQFQSKFAQTNLDVEYIQHISIFFTALMVVFHESFSIIKDTTNFPFSAVWRNFLDSVETSMNQYKNQCDKNVQIQDKELLHSLKQSKNRFHLSEKLILANRYQNTKAQELSSSDAPGNKIRLSKQFIFEQNSSGKESFRNRFYRSKRTRKTRATKRLNQELSVNSTPNSNNTSPDERCHHGGPVLSFHDNDLSRITLQNIGQMLIDFILDDLEVQYQLSQFDVVKTPQNSATWEQNTVREKHCMTTLNPMIFEIKSESLNHCHSRAFGRTSLRFDSTIVVDV